MQDKTINNALLALHRQGIGVDHVEALLALRGVAPNPPQRKQDRPLWRGKCRRIALGCLPCTTSVAADAVQAALPDITRKSALNRAYLALLRLEDMGVVVRDGRVWRLAQFI